MKPSVSHAMQGSELHLRQRQDSQASSSALKAKSVLQVSRADPSMFRFALMFLKCALARRPCSRAFMDEYIYSKAGSPIPVLMLHSCFFVR